MRLFLISLHLILCSSLAFGNEILSWNRSIEEASKNNSEIRSAQENYRSSEYLKRAAYSGFLPQIAGTLEYTRANGNVFTSIDPSTNVTTSISQSSNNYDATLTGSENLFSGFLDKAKVDQAEANARVTKMVLDVTLAKVSNDLAIAYAGLVYAQRAVKLQEDIIVRREENFKLVELHFESGLENKGSVLLSKANLNQANYNKLLANDSIRVAQVDLSRVLGRNEVGDFSIEQDAPSQSPPPTPDFVSLAMTTPEYIQSVANEDSARAGVDLIASSFYPAVNVDGSIGREGETWFPRNFRWFIGASLTLPIFNGATTYHSTKSAVAILHAASETTSDLRRQQITKLQTAYVQYVEAFEKLKVDQSFEEAAKMRADIARNKYNNGLLTFEDWDIIENDLITREQNLLQSLRDRVTAESTWNQALGKGALKYE